ncbi:MAG: hypothetical protein LIV24_02310 [Eubacterium sp.]|nr:hypothetical protein [Eubacterium sp.]
MAENKENQNRTHSGTRRNTSSTDSRVRENKSSTRSSSQSEKHAGMYEQRMSQERQDEQDEIALARERARRRKRRRELERRRRKRRRIIRMVKIFLCLAVAVLALTGVLAVVRKYKGDQKKAADEAAAAAEAAQTTDIYPASEVLHLSFPALTLDETKSTSASKTENGNASGSDDTSGGDGTSDADNATDENNASDANGSTADSTASDTDAAASVSSTASGTLTVTEFQNILQDLYNQNYVLVDLYSLAQSTTTGFEAGKVSVPKGKKPLIISETGLGYTSGYDGHADQLVADANGGITNTYTDSKGKLQTGDADVAACLDTFIESHPDFSYKDARGVLGITGEDGMFGYALKETGKQVGKLSSDAIRKASGESVSSSSASQDSGSGESVVSSGSTENTNTSGNTGTTGSEVTAEQVEKNKETLSALITTLRAEGWHLASGTYADISYASDVQLVKTDADSWTDEVGALVGDTDILLLPHGGDIGSWSGYSETDERYKYLEKLGFRYYLTENDQEFSWIQIDTSYVRIGTHTIFSKADYDQVMQMQ